MGKAAHVVVTNEPEDLFVHLHPSGTISMAALQRFEVADQVKVAGAEHATHARHALTPSEVSIAYAFRRDAIAYGSR